MTCMTKMIQFCFICSLFHWLSTILGHRSPMFLFFFFPLTYFTNIPCWSPSHSVILIESLSWLRLGEYRVKEEKLQDQRLIAEWGKEQGGRKEERKVKNKTQREQVIVTLNTTCKRMKLWPSLEDNYSNMADWVPKDNVGYFIKPLVITTIITS